MDKKKYTVLVQETRSKEVIVKAPSAEAAREWALDNISFEMYDPNEEDNLVAEVQAIVQGLDR